MAWLDSASSRCSGGGGRCSRSGLGVATVWERTIARSRAPKWPFSMQCGRGQRCLVALGGSKEVGHGLGCPSQRPRRHEDWAIATIHPLPADAPFPNVRDVLEDFIVEHRQLGLRDIQRCPFGEAYVRLTRVRDRDKLVLDSPHEFGDVFISFVRHDEGRNHRRVHLNRVVWLLLTGVPFDFRTTEDLACAVSKFGRMISWDKEDDHMGRIVVKARFLNLDTIPKSLRWSEGDEFEGDGWSSSIEVLASELLGGGPADEDPLPPANEDPHPLPENDVPAEGLHVVAAINNEMDVQVAENWDNWDDNHQHVHNAELEDLLDAVQQEEMAWADGEEVLPAPSNSSFSSDMSFSEGDNSHMFLPSVTVGTSHARADFPAIAQPAAVVMATGLQNILKAYQSDDEEPPVLQEKNQEMAALHDQPPANPMQHVAPLAAQPAPDVSPPLEVASDQPALLEAALEPVMFSDLPMTTAGSSVQVLKDNAEHVITARGSLQPVENLEDLQSGLQAFLFHIPDKCPTSHAPICQVMEEGVQDKGKENIGVPANLHDVESQALLQPFGQENLRKRRSGKTPLVETEVRRSDRIKKDNAGYKRNSCPNNNCLPCNVVPPIIKKSVVKNLTASFCKVSEGELEDMLAKKPKRMEEEVLDKVPLAKGEEHATTSS
uniref:DUF7597 domain-containing protein n=1 Tax=Aegilops tauschii TaxID=37682 RepID=R7WEP3_AEGTA